MKAPILVPLDGSHIAEQALSYAVAQAKREGSPILLVRAVSLPSLMLLPAMGMASMSTEAYQREAHSHRVDGEKYLHSKAAELRAEGLDVTTQIALGTPTDVILNAMRESSPEMIVMTTHGRTGVGRWFLGSVAEDVLRQSPVPVLLIRSHPTTGPETNLQGRTTPT